MKTGKITAKLRDMVPVCFMVNGEERKRYANIEIPDEVKELEMLDFHFNTHMDGKITFEIHLDESVLPEQWPAPRARKTRASFEAEHPPGEEAAPPAASRPSARRTTRPAASTRSR